MVEIREVRIKKEQKQFIEFPLNLYKDNKFFVPPLYSDEMKIFKSDYHYYDQSRAKYWNAYIDGKIVGRISAILQLASNEKWKQKRVRFTRFDCINNQEVADKLFEVVQDYAKSVGMNEIVGPLGFSDLEREGLLIEGFDQENTFEEQYNYSYYSQLIENSGFKKEVDWIEHRITIDEDSAQKVIKLADKILSKGDIKIVPVLSFKKYVSNYKDSFFDILDSTYNNIYGTVPFSEGMKNLLISNFSSIINLNYVPIVTDKDNNIIAFGIALPSMSKIFQKSGGHLYPTTIAKLLYNKKHPEIIDLGLIGATPEGKIKGAQVVVFGEFLRSMLKDKVKYAETNLNLEYNNDIISVWSHFKTVQNKRRRLYIKEI